MSFFALGKRSTGTFRPRKEPVGSKQHLLRQFAEATLGSGSLRKAVQLPPGENRQEWIAANTVEFYTQINMLWGTVCEFCTEITCPAMTAGPRVRYGWAASSSEPDAGAPRMLPAPAYINALSAWAQGLLDDPAIFPVEIGREFPPDFERVVQVLWKRLFRIYAHIYWSHYNIVQALGQEAHLNTSFKHFVLFSEAFGLIKREDMAPMEDLIHSMFASEKAEV